MFNLYDIAYSALLVVAAPYWLLKSTTRNKVLQALSERMGHVSQRSSTSPAIWIHAVSLGEMNATRALIDELRRRRADLEFIVSTTTTTGYARGLQLYGESPSVRLIRYPLDFSSAIRRSLDALRPSAVVLMELEIWPNFVRQCAKRDIPVMIANGRITEPSFRKYLKAKPIISRMMRRLWRVCVQDETYAKRFIEMGALADRVRVTGTMKFDTAEIAERVDGDADLAASVGLSPAAGPLWVCGSTGPGEEAIVLFTYRALLAAHPHFRLAIIPRHPERFDEVANLIQANGFDLIRRSTTKISRGSGGAVGVAQDADERRATSSTDQHFAAAEAVPLNTDRPQSSPSVTGKSETARSAARDTHSLPSHTSVSEEFNDVAPSVPAVILGDTMGELRKFYSLANIVFVGRSLVDLGARQHGSDMIEPAALAKPVLVGPFTGNFTDAMLKFRAAHAIIEVADAAKLRERIAELLSNPDEVRQIGQRAQQVVQEQKGATARHADEILALLDPIAPALRRG